MNIGLNRGTRATAWRSEPGVRFSWLNDASSAGGGGGGARRRWRRRRLRRRLRRARQAQRRGRRRWGRRLRRLRGQRRRAWHRGRSDRQGLRLRVCSDAVLLQVRAPERIRSASNWDPSRPVVEPGGSGGVGAASEQSHLLPALPRKPMRARIPLRVRAPGRVVLGPGRHYTLRSRVSIHHAVGRQRGEAGG